MKNLFAIGLIAAATVSMAFAADPIETRKGLMKEVGAQMKILVPMSKGETPFDAAAAGKAFDAVSKNTGEFVKLFPDNSKEGGKTEASPKIWTDKAGFEKASAKFITDAEAAKSAKDLESFKLAFKTFAANCASCHESYRVKKD